MKKVTSLLLAAFTSAIFAGSAMAGTPTYSTQQPTYQVKKHHTTATHHTKKQHKSSAQHLSAKTKPAAPAAAKPVVNKASETKAKA